MNTNIKELLQFSINPFPRYIQISTKFVFGHVIAILWTLLSIYISIPWVIDLSKNVTLPIAIFVISGIAFVPGYLNTFMVVSLLLDKQPKCKNEYPITDVTILIAARNEAENIKSTLSYIARQDYTGKIKVILIDNNSVDETREKAIEASEELNLDLLVLHEGRPGKFNALNCGLKEVKTEVMMTLDADTLLHESAVRYLVARIESSPKEVCAVAGSVLVRNSRKNLLAKVQEWDYFLGIASIKRMQGLYQGTLVAQGAYSLYKTNCLKEVGGWPNAIGEDIVLTWNLLKKGWKVYFEPLAVAFTEVPINLKHFARQRSRWARGMIEALKKTKPWHQPRMFTKYLTGVNLVMPFTDFVFTFVWIPGLVLAFYGYYWIVGPTTLFVIPLTLLSYQILYIYQRLIFRKLNLRIRKNKLGYVIFILFYQMLMSPISVIGYIQELTQLERVW
ncbi:glycosyltransferase [Heliobacillus mobilis]|uniref:Glycosyltransferase n=1 Tax=Heliobacterium mobile TaxID=28064 RepID=A0A6I3SLI7_HELMO|nr:glycosyltransferase [Heliobacterium mobile]